MEVSHRGKAFVECAAQTEALLRELMGVPENYRVLFLQGGASGQFDAIPHWRAGSGVLLFTGSLATLEARTTAIHQAGDHSIIVGEVIATGLDDDPDDALVHYRSRYGSIA